MQPETSRKPPSLLSLCVTKLIDNVRHVVRVDGVEPLLLERILPHCTLDQLAGIESRTRADISGVTDPLWQRFYRERFGAASFDLAAGQLRRRSQASEALRHYTWKEIFDEATERQKEEEDEMMQRLTDKFQAAKAQKQSRQIKMCSMAPPCRKRGIFRANGQSKSNHLSSSSSSCNNYKNPMMKKAKMEVDFQARMIADVRRSNHLAARPLQPSRIATASANAGQAMKAMTTVRRSNSTIVITKPMISSSRVINRPMQNSRPRF